MSFYAAGHDAARAGGKRSSTLHWLAHLGAPGLFAVSFIDATIIPLAVPGSTDLLLLWLISRGGNPYLPVASAVIGSLMGGWTTWRLGKKGGEAAIKRYVPPRLQHHVQGWSQKHPLLVVFLPAILPPPLPLWPFLLAAGALGATARRFLAAFGAGRLLRYSLVGWLAITYGRRMVRLWSATLERWSTPILFTFIALTAAGFAFSIWKLRRTSRRVTAAEPAEPAATTPQNVPGQPLPSRTYSHLI